MPSEKYSPFLLVLRVYFWPFSWLDQMTTASAMGLPSASLHTPLTVPAAWEKPGGTHSPSSKKTNMNTAKCFFIVASRRKLLMIY